MSYSKYDQYGGNPYQHTPDPKPGQTVDVVDLRTGSPYNSKLEHESSNYSQVSQYSQPGSPGQGHHGPALLTQPYFLERVKFADAEINSLISNVQSIAALHQRDLSAPDNNFSAQIENLVTQTQLKNTQIRDEVKFLETDASKTQDTSKAVKALQANKLKKKFEDVLKGYHQDELDYRQRYREQIKRQYRIVNPDASEEEVLEASEADWGSDGVFQTALKSNRAGQASSALQNVRERHRGVKLIESTLVQLAGLFADLAQQVQAQSPQFESIEEKTGVAADDVEKGNEEVVKATDHAKRRRRNKCWCLLIVVLIIVAIALGIGLGYGLTQSNKKN